jgi:hypothetical protein
MLSLQRRWSQNRLRFTAIMELWLGELPLTQPNWRERLVTSLAFATIFVAGAIMHGRFTSLRSPHLRTASYIQTASTPQAK